MLDYTLIGGPLMGEELGEYLAQMTIDQLLLDQADGWTLIVPNYLKRHSLPIAPYYGRKSFDHLETIVFNEKWSPLVVYCFADSIYPCLLDIDWKDDMSLNFIFYYRNGGIVKKIWEFGGVQYASCIPKDDLMANGFSFSSFRSLQLSPAEV